MAPKQFFWVILIGNTPTSFRAKSRDDLVPTLRQLQRTQAGVTLRWFERGRVWESPSAAEGAAKLAATEARERRSKDWRPGGEHRDPKARFVLTRDQKRAKFKRREEQQPGQTPDGHPREEHPLEERRTDTRPAGPGRRGTHDHDKRTGPAQSPFGASGRRPPRRDRPADRPGADKNPFGSRESRTDSKPRAGKQLSRPVREDRRSGRPPKRRP